MVSKLLSLPSFFLFIFLFSGTSALAQGDLMIMPKRLVFDGKERSKEITLANTGADTAIYAISFIQYNMTEDGNFEEITEPVEDQRFATDFLRYFPRRVSLAPNESQTVRIQLTRTGNLEEGEYRSHVYFRAVEETTALGMEEKSEAEGISIKINTVFGISIPVIIRHGESTTSLALEDLKLDYVEGNPKLNMTLVRQGNMSVYGDITVEHISPSGLITNVGQVKSLSVYTPNKKREFSFQLQVPENMESDLSDGKLKVTYTSEGAVILATNEIKL